MDVLDWLAGDEVCTGEVERALEHGVEEGVAVVDGPVDDGGAAVAQSVDGGGEVEAAKVGGGEEGRGAVDVLHPGGQLRRGAAVGVGAVFKMKPELVFHEKSAEARK